MRKKMPSGTQGMMTKEISEGIKTLLGKHVRILLKCAVKMESKGDKTENRILVFCPCRFFCLKVPPRIDFHFHYLEVQAIESKKSNQLVLTANDKSHSFLIPDQDKVDMIDKMIVTLITALSETFPGIPLYNIVRKIDVVPSNRLHHLDHLTFDVASTSSGSGGSGSMTGLTSTNSTPLPYPKSKSTSSLEESNVAIVVGGGVTSSPIVGGGATATHNLVNIQLSGGGGGSGSNSSSTGGSSTNLISLSGSVLNPYQHHAGGGGGGASGTGPCGGFSTQYAWMCDLHGLPYREEVAWDVDTIYLSHDSRELCLHDFDHLETRDLVPILSGLEYNTWFKSVRSSSVKLSHEAIDRFLHVVRKSLTIEELHLDNIGLKADFAQKLSAALSYNTNSQVHTLDLSHNMIEDKGAIHLSNPLAKLCRGPVWLNLSQCGLSAKGVAQLAHALALNRCAPNSLTHLNLSGNSLKDDINNLCNFLAQPNSITFLDLSGTDCNLETVFGALLRGCTSHLAQLSLSRNNFATKKGKEIPPSFKQFLTSSLALKQLSMSSCKLSLEALKQLLLGLACNESTADVELDISSNGLGQQGAHVLESCLHGIKCLSSLDISDNSLEGDLAGVVTAASKNKSLKHLNLGRNLQSTKSKHVAQVMEAIVQMLQEEDCVLQTLSLADSKLKGELYSVINALGSNQCLQNIDISGNQMGDVGARLLAKALQINSKLRCITYDRNNITLQGFSDIAYGLESNLSVRYMPYPIHDALPCMKVSGEKTENVLKRIQDLIYRNSQPKKTCNNQQAFRLQQGFLLSSAQQTVDKLISQTQDGIKLLRKNELNSPSGDANYGDVISHAENLIHDSERAKQLLVNLHELIEQKGEAGKVIERKLQSLADDLHGMLSQHIQGNIENVLELTEEKCPSLMGDEALKEDIKQGCIDKTSSIQPEFVRHCVVDMAGTDIINKLNEVHLAVAAHISDKLVDRAIDSLMKCHKQLNDASKKRSSTPDVLKTRLMRSSPSDLSGKDMDGCGEKSQANCGSEGNFQQLSDQSPMATPQMQAKRKGMHGRRCRPKSVVDCVEGISADDIPDLLPSIPKTIEELPPVSPQQLKHLGKARPKKPKTRAPTRPHVRPPTEVIEEASTSDLQEGLDTFFRPGSTTPTPIVTPDSDECSTSLMISMTSTASTTAAGGGDDDTSIQSTPTHSSRTFKVDPSGEGSERTSPGSFDSCSISSKLSMDAVPRSKSTDCLEKPGISKPNSLLTPTPPGGRGGGSVSPSGSTQEEDGQKSPVGRIGVSIGNNVMAEMKARQEKRTSGFYSNSASLEKTKKSSVQQEETSGGVTVTTNSVSISSEKSSVLQETKEKLSGGSGGTEVVSGTETVKEKFITSGISVSAAKEKFGSGGGGSVSVSETKEKFGGGGGGGVSVSEAKEKFASKNNASSGAGGVVTRRPPPVAPKPRPWSHVGADRRSGEYSLGSDNSSPSASNANTPDSGDLLDDHQNSSGELAGKTSPMNHHNLHHHHLHHHKSSSSSQEPMSLPVVVNSSSVVSSSTSSPSNHLHHQISSPSASLVPNFISSSQNNQNNQSSTNNSSTNNANNFANAKDSSITSITTTITSSSSSTTTHASHNNNPVDSSPVSLPAWGTEKRSVKELAASLARAQKQTSVSEDLPKKKADSLPRNVTAPAGGNTGGTGTNIEQQQDFNRARVSIQEWTKHNSINEVWKVPLRKFSTDKPVTKRWDPNNGESNKSAAETLGVGRLRKVSNDEDVVNV